jgi:hypothetical protein
MFSAARAALPAKNAVTDATIGRETPIPVPPCPTARLKSYDEGLLGAIAVTPLESTRMELSGGTRYDPRVIDSLKREFGRELLDMGWAFCKAIPRNKHLTKVELVHLCNYLELHARPGKVASFSRFLHGLSLLNKQLRMHRFDGIGIRTGQWWDSDQILIFNPSRIVPISVHYPSVEAWDKGVARGIRMSEKIALPVLHSLYQCALVEEQAWGRKPGKADLHHLFAHAGCL